MVKCYNNNDNSNRQHADTLSFGFGELKNTCKFSCMLSSTFFAFKHSCLVTFYFNTHCHSLFQSEFDKSINIDITPKT